MSEVVEVAVIVAEPVTDLFGGKAGKEQVGAKVWFGRSGFAQQVAAVLTPEGMRAGAEPSSDGGGLRQQHQVELTVQEPQVAGDERGEPVGRVSPGTQRWRAGEDQLLKLPLPLIEQRDRQAALVGEPPVERPLAHSGRGRDIVHGDTVDSSLAEQPLRGGQHPQPVAGGVCALSYHSDIDHRQLDTAQRDRVDTYRWRNGLKSASVPRHEADYSPSTGRRKGTPMARTISRDEVKTGLDAGTLTLVDALPESYYDQQHLPGAINLVADDVDTRAARLLPDKNAPIVTYCSNPSCANSGLVAAKLENLGYTNVRRYGDGIQDWTEAGLSTESLPARC